VEALRPPLVSVLMPTYNRARFVTEAVRSVLDQSYEALELVVVDDGSTDETRDVLAAVHDARLRVVATPHRGIGAALNAGLAIASGDFVARLDSDDVWSRTMLADQLSALTARPDVDVVYARSEVIDERGDRKNEYWGQPLRFPDDPLLSLLYVDPVCTITAVYRRRALDRVGPWAEHLEVGEDADLNLRVAMAGRFLFRDAVVALNRRHPGNQSRDPSRFHAGRRAVLDGFYARPDVPPQARAARALAYSNLDAEYGLHLRGEGRWREASFAFAQAIREAPNPVRAATRIVWFLTRV
jgi:glycosyltransferase involved in cell wall biosynthesis